MNLLEPKMAHHSKYANTFFYRVTVPILGASWGSGQRGMVNISSSLTKMNAIQSFLVTVGQMLVLLLSMFIHVDRLSYTTKTILKTTIPPNDRLHHIHLHASNGLDGSCTTQDLASPVLTLTYTKLAESLVSYRHKYIYIYIRIQS